MASHPHLSPGSLWALWPCFPFLVAIAGCQDASTSATSRVPVTAGGPELVYERVVGGNQDLYVMPANGGDERRLTSHPGQDGLPRWSRDGRSVYFGSDRSGNFQLYVVSAEGGEARRIRTNPHTEWQADPSPDGRRIAFLTNQEGAEHLFVMDLATGSEQALVRHGRKSILGNPAWSPDGGKIVFSSNWKFGHHIYVVGVVDGEERRLSWVHKGGCEPRFHPDGRRVVYVSRGHLSDKSRLVEHDLETGKERILLAWPALNYDPAYSPDGTEIAFASNITGDYAIYRQRLSDGQAWRVTHGAGPARYPDYRPVP